MSWQVEQARERAWERYKQKSPIKAVLSQVALVGIVVVGLFLFLFGGKAFAWWDCGAVCDARNHETFYRISQGCYCLDEEGKPYNPKDSL